MWDKIRERRDKIRQREQLLKRDQRHPRLVTTRRHRRSIVQGFSDTDELSKIVEDSDDIELDLY